ncbi:hypothetical protein L202_04011 [Cryptococcus amylolentus CBS 6039]|uniref:Translation initiation factor 3 N-terminal domain-containing protein n=2 Tax=Cryptococcus amylolentus TaxID=104669 RepID=A0A1E3HPT9_9TREE|nr:hypothetical protein L202_04011 [Cryptococcus amylolentus CBS 6039]ODN78370.1 hypothetical protein L202_04011 [Cryptococcus amylolentus CBS 6039]ODO07034.1 hypothetical protein I350_04402 [Cryptococcus amylolentus CBS 6273]
MPPLPLPLRTLMRPGISRATLAPRYASSRAPPSAPPPTSTIGLRDSAIPHRTVRLATPTGLSQPQSLSSILPTYDPSHHSLILVSTDGPHAIVKLVSRAEEREKEKEREDKERVKRKMGMEEKEVQVSWQSAKGDLEHKLDTAKGLLEKGDRVQVVFANRKRGDPVGDAQKKQVVDLFDAALGEVGKKWKNDDVNKGLWVLYYNPLDSVRQGVEKKVLDAETAKRREKESAKEEKLQARRKKEERRLKRAEEMEEQRIAEARKAEEDYRRRQEEAQKRKSLSFGSWRR